MKKLLISLSLVAAAFAASAQVAVHFDGELAPGVYGRITLGDSRPTLVYTQPTVIIHDRTYVEEPVYVYAPLIHQRRWHRYCHRYDACNRPVFFVQERWINDEYARQQERQHYRERREWRDNRWQERDDRWRDRDDRKYPHDRGDRPDWKHGDKDRDGVPNSRDHHPVDPNRR